MEATQILTVILAVATVAANIATAVTAYFVYLALNQEARGQQTQFFFGIVRRYNEISIQRFRLLQMDFTWETFHRTYPTIQQKLNSEEWKVLREVASCFEFTGILVKHKYIIDLNLLFDMVLVNPSGAPLWEHVKETIDNIRVTYNPNQWINWEFLVNKEKEYYKHKTQ